MRRLTEADRLATFMRALGRAAVGETRVYLTGGATAVLLGWCPTTIDIDLQMVPDRDELLRAIATLKDQLEVNVELAWPAQFIPELPGWEARSRFIAREGRVSFYHYDFYAQALAKIERGHSQDRADVAAMLEQGLVVPSRLRELFEEVAPQLHRHRFSLTTVLPQAYLQDSVFSTSRIFRVRVLVRHPCPQREGRHEGRVVSRRPSGRSRVLRVAPVTPCHVTVQSTSIRFPGAAAWRRQRRSPTPIVVAADSRESA